jgi:hypothetical protein
MIMYINQSNIVNLSIVERPRSIHPLSFMKLMLTIEREVKDRNYFGTTSNLKKEEALGL